MQATTTIKIGSKISSIALILGLMDTAKQAATIDGLAAELLETTLSLTGWHNYWLAREESIVLPETDEAGKTTWSCGAYYRVRLD